MNTLTKLKTTHASLGQLGLINVWIRNEFNDRYGPESKNYCCNSEVRNGVLMPLHGTNTFCGEINKF